MSIQNGQQVWIAGKNMTQEPGAKEDSSWEFAGVFLTEQEAVAACKNWRYFIGPAVIGEVTPDDESVDWEGAYYPLGRAASERIPLGLPGSLWPTDLLESKSEQHA